MASLSERERHASVAPYIQTFAYLHTQRRRRRSRRHIPGAVLVAGIALAVALATWPAPADAPAGRSVSPQTIAAGATPSRPDTAEDTPANHDDARVALAPFVGEVDGRPSQASAPVAESPPPAGAGEPSQSAEARGPETEAQPGAPQSAPPRAAVFREDPPARVRSAKGYSVYAIRRLLDRYAAQLASRAHGDGGQ